MKQSWHKREFLDFKHKKEQMLKFYYANETYGSYQWILFIPPEY